MNAKQSKVATAVKAAIRGGNFYDDGVILGQDTAVTVDAIAAVLKTCKNPKDTAAVREGFIAGYRGASGKTVSYDAAKRKFYRMAKMHLDPKANRQSKANAKKAADAAIAAAAAPTATVMSEKDMAKALIGATLFIAEWQGKTQDADVLGRLGKLLAIITPKAVKGKSKAAPVEILDADESDAE